MSFNTKKCAICKRTNNTLHWHRDEDTGSICEWRENSCADRSRSRSRNNSSGGATSESAAANKAASFSSSSCSSFGFIALLIATAATGVFRFSTERLTKCFAGPRQLGSDCRGCRLLGLRNLFDGCPGKVLSREDVFVIFSQQCQRAAY